MIDQRRAVEARKKQAQQHAVDIDGVVALACLIILLISIVAGVIL